MIEFVNAQKALNGSAEKNIVLGASMGGLCGYWALGKMEEDEVDHQVSKFITMDTPFRGANIPIGLQLMIKHLANYRISRNDTLGDRRPVLKLAESALNLPASKQMMYFNAWNPAKNGFSTWRNDFYAQLHTVTISKAEHIAISNGSGIGEGQLMTCGGLYMDLPEVGESEFKGSFKIKKAKTYLVSSFSPDQDLYEFSFYKRILYNLIWEWGSIGGYNIPSVDCVPGGVSDFGIATIFGSEFGEETPIEEMFPQANRSAFCFVPTISSQNIADQSNFFLSFSQGSCANQSISDCVQSRDNNYISPFTGTAAHNQNHVVLTSNLATYLLNGFFNPGFTSPIDNFTYNFGKREPDQPVNPAVLSFTSTPSVININTEISNTGQLWINRIDKLAKTNVSSNPENDENQLFEVYITKDCNGDPVIVEVHSGGKLHVGESDNPSINKGILHIMEDAVLIIDDGGEALTEDQSQIQIEENGILEIKEGGLANTIFGSGISVKAGGKLIVRDGGILRLSHYSSLTIEPGGLLLFEDGAILQLWDAPAVDGEARIIVKGALEIQGEIDYDGNGFFDFYPGHELKLTNGTLTLDGYGKASRLIRLTEGTNLNLGDAEVEISNCRIVYESGSSIFAEEGGLKFNNVDFQGHQNKTNGIEPINIFRLEMEECTFRDHDVGINVDGATGTAIAAGFIFEDCDFTDNSIGIAAFNVPLTIIKNSDFDNGIGADNTGLFLYDCGKLDIRGTMIIGFDYGIKTFRTPWLYLFNSTISHCDYGIYDADATGVQPSAVYLIHDSEISSCVEGIFMIGNEFEGLVFMDCARLWNNDIGVHGSDITLAIDAKAHALATDGTIRPNSFKRNSGGKYFDICYLEKWEYIGNNFSATLNYWDEEPTTNSSSGQYFIRKPATSVSSNCSSGTLAVQMSYTPGITTQPEECIPRMAIVHGPDRTISIDFSDKDCAQIVYLDTTTIAGTYSAGISSFYEGELDNAITYLEKVAASTLDTISVVCADYIRTARAMAPPSVLQRPAPDQNQEIASDEIRNDHWLIRPVPFNDKLIITSNLLEGSAQVMDMTGRVIYSFELESNNKSIEFLTQSWNPGIYLIRINTISGETISQKILKN